MIRIIVKNTYYDSALNIRDETYTTLDFNIEELEELLSKGGYGESGFEMHKVIGVEILKNDL